MTTIKIAKHMAQSLAKAILVTAAVCGIIFASGAAKAEDPTPSEAAIAEMKKMLGGVPAEMQLYPESARAAGWEMMKAADFNKNTALPTKVRELIGLAVAAQIPCQYCVYYHIKSAKAAGASEEEMREAVHQASRGTGARYSMAINMTSRCINQRQTPLSKTHRKPTTLSP